MNSEYKVSKFKLNNLNDFDDRISIEEPLEIIIKYNDKGIWVEKTISITMRTPGDDEDLVRGFLFNEKVIEKIDYIEKIEITGVPTEQYGLKNKIIVTINNSKNIDIDKIKRNFLTNSSCGVCGKSSLDTLEIIKKDKILKSNPKISKEVLMNSPNNLRQNQSEFSKTGGIHASGLFTTQGDIIAIKEDYNNKKYTSARVNTQDKYEFLYGRVEMKAKLPNWEGMWPAFWMLGANFDTVGWPFCGELDILEHGDYVKSSTINDPGLISSAVHYGPSDHDSQYASIPNTFYFDTGQENFVRAETTIEKPFEDFHTYSLHWSPEKLEFFVDEEIYFEFPLATQSSPFDKPFFMLINLAVGGHWTDGYIAPNFTNATYEIDYVRVYQ